MGVCDGQHGGCGFDFSVCVGNHTTAQLGRLYATKLGQHGVGVCDGQHGGCGFVCAVGVGNHTTAQLGRLYATKLGQHGVGVCADAGLLARLASEITRRRSLDDFDPQALANTVWAFATANMADAGLFARLASEITRRRSLDDFTPQALANTVWACAVADEHDIVSLIIDHILVLSEGPSAPSWSIVHQAVLESSAAWHAHLSSSRAGVVEEWRQARCLRAQKTSEPSQLQRQVYRALRELEVKFIEVFIVSELGYSVDARLLLGTDRKVVLEVDGPSHFLEAYVRKDLAKPSGLRETGATFLKHRQLKRAGWTVVQVPYWEWDALTRAQQAPYLRDKLARL